MSAALSVTIQPIPYLPSAPSIKSMSLQLRDKHILQDSVKHFAQVTNDISHSSSLL